MDRGSCCTASWGGRWLAIGVFAALCAVAAGAEARADAIPFPVAGLRVDVPAGEHWEIRGHASSDPEADGAIDALTRTRADGVRAAYRVRIGNRVAPSCPLRTVAAHVVAGDTWLVDNAVNAACWAGPDARIVVFAASPIAPVDDALLSALTTAVRARRVVAPPARLDAASARPAIALEHTHLAFTPPDDGFVWRSPLEAGSTSARRTFDALLRVVPAYPEAQIQVRRHAGESCLARTRRMESGPWTRSGETYVRTVGGFLARAHCRDRPDGALDVRVFLAPGADEVELDRVVAALLDAPSTGPAPASEAGESSASALFATAALEAGGSRGGLDVALATDLVWTAANGPFLRMSAALGTFRSFEASLGVGLRLPHGALFAVTLGARFDDLPILRNTTLSGGFEFHTDLLRADRFAWSLRFTPFHLASDQPAVTGAPLVVAWQGILPSGLTFGLILRWVAAPTRARDGWTDSGTMLGATFGWGLVAR